MHILGKTSLAGLVGGLCTFTVPYVLGARSWLEIVLESTVPWVAIQASSIFYWYMQRRRRPDWKIQAHVWVRGSLLGLGISAGQSLVWLGVDRNFGVYLTVLSFFHYSEFLVTSVINPAILTLDSFLLNHSKAYGIAAFASYTEYWMEVCFCPWIKTYEWPMRAGLFFCIAGELLRKGAMLTAWNNFTHTIRDRRVEGHQLVTHGLYALCRHPSYCGWFWWSIGTQLILVNPVCVLAYTVVSWQYFQERIHYEEATLLSFFGHKYFQYQSSVPRSGVPFVKGYVLGAEKGEVERTRKQMLIQTQRFGDSQTADTESDSDSEGSAREVAHHVPAANGIRGGAGDCN